MTDAQWRTKLSPEAYRVARQGGTERPNGPEYDQWKQQGDGIYACVCCGAELFSSQTKFDSKSGWPSFYKAKNRKNVQLIEDRSLGMTRTEVRCARCDAHLGHVFEGEGYDTPTDKRYCINAVCLRFAAEKAQ